MVNAPWETSKFPGIEHKVLYSDPNTGMATLLFRLAPGAVVPLHEHTGVELTYVLEGSLEDEEGVCTTGNFVWRPAGNTHEARAPHGALLLGVFMSPNHFAAGQNSSPRKTRAEPGHSDAAARAASAVCSSCTACACSPATRVPRASRLPR